MTTTLSNRVSTGTLRVLAVAWLAVGGISCSDNNLTSPSDANQLNGTWRLFQMTTSAGVHNEQLTAGRFNVSFAPGTIQVKSDCNTCSGTTSLSGATLTVNPLACTLAACSSAPIDTRYSGVLTGALTVRINDRLLQLNSTAGSELRFEK